jgi:flavin reductase (DIM6/NTAB) family NADH-FMN oxidoreductase RutF
MPQILTKTPSRMATPDARGNRTQSADERNALRSALGRFPTGVTVISTRAPGGQVHCMTVNSFASLSLDPPLILWALRAHSARFETFAQCELFSVNILSELQLDLARSHAAPTLAGVDANDWDEFLSDCPVVEGAAAHFVCRAGNHVRQGDHAILIGEVVKFAEYDRKPLLFMSGVYFAGSNLKPL